jgi:hypothetical protein
MTTCDCVIKNREEGESQREWFKRWMCMYHWMQSDYYQNKLEHEWEFYMNGSFCKKCGAVIGSGVPCK